MNQDRASVVEAIWKKQKEELFYWICEHLDGLEARNVSIHEIEMSDGRYSHIIYDIDDKAAVLIETDTTASNVKESHKYMMIEPSVLSKLVSLQR